MITGTKESEATSTSGEISLGRQQDRTPASGLYMPPYSQDLWSGCFYGDRVEILRQSDGTLRHHIHVSAVTAWASELSCKAQPRTRFFSEAGCGNSILYLTASYETPRQLCHTRATPFFYARFRTTACSTPSLRTQLECVESCSSSYIPN